LRIHDLALDFGSITRVHTNISGRQKFVKSGGFNFFFLHLAPDISNSSFYDFLYNAFLLGFYWHLVMKGAGMHKMGRKWTVFTFFRFDLVLSEMDRLHDWLFPF